MAAAAARTESQEDISDLLLTLQTACERLSSMYSIVMGATPKLSRAISAAYKQEVSIASSQPVQSDEVCVQAALLVFEVLNKVLSRIVATLSEAKVRHSKTLISLLYTRVAQLKSLSDYAIQATLHADPEEIYFKPMTSPEWQLLEGHYSVYAGLECDGVG